MSTLTLFIQYSTHNLSWSYKTSERHKRDKTGKEKKAVCGLTLCSCFQGHPFYFLLSGNILEPCRSSVGFLRTHGHQWHAGVTLASDFSLSSHGMMGL